MRCRARTQDGERCPLDRYHDGPHVTSDGDAWSETHLLDMPPAASWPPADFETKEDPLPAKIESDLEMLDGLTGGGYRGGVSDAPIRAPESRGASENIPTRIVPKSRARMT